MDNRYFFDLDNKNDTNIKIIGQEHQHLTKVRRAKIGDNIVAFCGDGNDYDLEIKEITKNYANCQIVRTTQNIATIRPNVTVYIASVKSDALDEAIDNLTQLNIKNIVIFESEYTNVHYSAEKCEKMKAKCIQSCKQCERADIPEIRLIKFKDMLEELKNNDLNIFAYENAEENFLNLKLEKYKDKKIAVIVGGEGGFSTKEAEALSSVSARVSLGKTILRAPVAVTALTASVLAGLGEWHR